MTRLSPKIGETRAILRQKSGTFGHFLSGVFFWRQELNFRIDGLR